MTGGGILHADDRVAESIKWTSQARTPASFDSPTQGEAAATRPGTLGP
jgi:hypothetical protein